MKNFTTISFLFLFAIVGLSTACKKDTSTDDSCPTENILSEFTTPEGATFIIYSNGEVFSPDNGACAFQLTYFDPNYKTEHYTQVNDEIFLLLEDNSKIPVRYDYWEDFERYTDFTDMFPKSVLDTHLYWTAFTLQSPSAKQVSDYVALRQCILNGTCDFIDNTISLVADPDNADNQVLKFEAVAPTEDMVTSKSSLGSGLFFFEKGGEFWYQADYYFENGLPFSIVDLENRYFEGSPGPRVVISGGKLAVENKFGSKIIYRQDENTAIEVPQNQWVTIKLHFVYDDTENGLIELWQDGQQLLSLSGINLPTANSIQNSIEVGLTASSQEAILYMDNMKISDQAF